MTRARCPALKAGQRFRPMSPKMVGVAEWELRLGDFRVFYDLDQDNAVVKIEAVGYKQGSKLFVHGKEYQL